MTKKEIENKRIETAIKKQPVSKIVDNLLVLVLVLNRDTGKVLDIVSKPSICNNNLTVDKDDKTTINYLKRKGYEVTKLWT